MFIKKALILPAAVAATALGVLGTTACSAGTSDAVLNTGHPATAAPASRGVHNPRGAAASDPTVCTTSYDKGAASTEASMYNGTGQTLTLVAALTGHNGVGEHWAAQPPATLAPGQCAVMNAYTNDAVEAIGVHAVYQLPNGDFVPFSADSHNGPENSTVFSAEPTYDWGNTTWTGTQDPRYNIWGDTTAGTFHVHVALKLEGGNTDSEQLSSSSFTVPANGTTSTWSAECGLGYHVRMDASTDKPMVTVNSATGDTSALTLTTLSPTVADGTVDGTTQYEGFDYALKNSSPSPVTATIGWTCDPSVWGTNGTAPTFLQDSPPATVPSGTPLDYRFTTLGFPAPTYGVKSGQLPPGTSLDINGDLTGTPTTPGSYSFTVVADNAAGSVTTDQLTITVA